MIFCVEDDSNIRELVVYTLESTGFQARGFEDGSSFLEALALETPELVLLDIMLPGEDGMELLSKLKASKKTREIPVIMVTAKGAEYDKVKGLDAGADDYVTKPFKLQELLSRVRALLRRSAASVIKSNDVTLDAARMTVYKNGVDVLATKTEFQILAILIKNSGLIVTRDTLLQNIWEDGSGFVDDNTLSVHISRLRDKIGRQHIKTVKGVGYRWESAD